MQIICINNVFLNNFINNSLFSINPKRAGLFCLSQVRGGGGGGGFRPPPPSDLGRRATKNSEIWHIRRVGQYERADKISILKIKAFLNYATLC